MKQAARYGLVSGGLVLALYLVTYLLHKPSFVALWPYGLSFLPVVFFMWKAVELPPLEERVSLRTWLRYPFMVFFISSAIFYIFYFTLLYSDAGLADLWFEARDALVKQVMGEDARGVESDRSLPGFSYCVFRFIFGLLGGFILSALVIQIKRSRS